ncbi:MAG TPA: MazG family protein [Mycobacteriales bacterium]|nr:MazG family protein [Mycobacteriales bacterium]
MLSWPAWAALRSGPVFADDTEQARAVAAAGIAIGSLPAADRERAFAFRDAARAGGTAAWLTGPDGDPGFVRALGDLTARSGGTAVMEVVYGSWDPPGSRLLDLVAAMDRLRRDCPWDREQTHQSLAPYLLEEAYEAYDALQSGDDDALREELGDVLLQVAFHSRIAAEAEDGWSIDDVAEGLIQKLVRRHPHVFAGLEVTGADEVNTNWDAIKRAEKSRESVLDGVPLILPALLLAHTLQRKAAKAGVPEELIRTGPPLFLDVATWRAAGVDAEAELRAAALQFRDRLLAAERAARVDGVTEPDAAAWRRYWPAG